MELMYEQVDIGMKVPSPLISCVGPFVQGATPIHLLFSEIVYTQVDSHTRAGRMVQARRSRGRIQTHVGV